MKFASLILKDKSSNYNEFRQRVKPAQLINYLTYFIILQLSFFNCQLSFSQTRDLWLKQLTDSSFHGRGYVHHGDKIAADYLEGEFKKLGALPVKNNYRQYFHHDINTFPDSMRVTVNGKNLIPGVDYIVDGNSGSCFKDFDTILFLSGEERLDDKKLVQITGRNCVVVWDLHGLDRKEPENAEILVRAYQTCYSIAEYVPVMILTSNKLTWSVGKEFFPNPIIQCTYENFPKDSITRISLSIKNKFEYKYQSSNVMGIIKAKKKSKKKKYLVYSAHYDHLGRMGDKTYFPGANDNASGTTMLLCLIEYYKKNPPKDFNVLFIAFGAEEAGIQGSKYFVENPLVPLEKIAFVMNMDIMGTGDEGITVVNATKHTKEFELLEKINSEKNYLVKIKKRGETSNSDHYWFDKNGVKSFFIYTMGGIQAYHDVFDKYETLPLTEFEDLKKMLVEFGDALLRK